MGPPEPLISGGSICTRRRLGVLHIEHVYPQKPNGKPLADHIGLVSRIGNLTLLHGSRNTSIKNNDCKAKKLPAFKKFDLLLNSRIAQQSTWGKSQVQQPQKVLAALAPDAWPLTLGENESHLSQRPARIGRERLPTEPKAIRSARQGPRHTPSGPVQRFQSNGRPMFAQDRLPPS